MLMPSDRYPQLVALLKDMGIPDKYGWIGGIRMRLAKMLVDLVRTQGRQQVTTKMLAALTLAEMIVLEENPPFPPDPHHMA